MDLLTLILLDVLFFFGSHLVTLIFYGIGMISEKPKSVMRWYIAGTILDVFAAFGLLSLIHRSQNGIPTKENLLSLTGSVVICTAFYFIMRRKANRLRNTTTAIPASRYQTQESEMGKFVVDSDTGEVIREEPPEPKPSNTNSARKPATCTKPVYPTTPPITQTASPEESNAPKNRWYKIAIAALSFVCVVLAIFVFLLGYSASSMKADNQQLSESVEALTAENAALQETVSKLESKNERAQKKISNLVEERNTLSERLDSVDETLDEVLEPYHLFHAGIGFIVSGSRYYHNYDCPVFQNADTYWAHNVEYCEYLGYPKCPNCW